MHYKLTLDSKLEESYQAGMATLKRWMAEEKVTLVEAAPSGPRKAPVYGWPGSPPRPDRSKNKPRAQGNATFRDVAAALFPHQDSQKLNLSETNQVAHIAQHLASKNEFFVTANLKGFILEGKRERLKGRFGVIALTPDEAVDILADMHGWKKS